MHDNTPKGGKAAKRIWRYWPVENENIHHMWDYKHDKELGVKYRCHWCKKPFEPWDEYQFKKGVGRMVGDNPVCKGELCSIMNTLMPH